jgi:WD40 repeat protein
MKGGWSHCTPDPQTRNLRISPDGNFLDYSYAIENSEIEPHRLWSAQDGKVIDLPDIKAVCDGVDWINEGKSIFYSNCYTTIRKGNAIPARILDLQTGALNPLSSTGSSSLRFSPDNRRILTFANGDLNSQIMSIIDLSSGELTPAFADLVIKDPFAHWYTREFGQSYWLK